MTLIMNTHVRGRIFHHNSLFLSNPLVTGAVLEIFARKEGWYEISRYECKVSVIEGEVVTSMGIETVMVIEEKCKRARRMER